MSQQQGNILEQLHTAGLIDNLPQQPTELASPWFVKILLGFSGWLASLFLLGSTLVTFSFLADNSLIMLLIGTLMIAGSYALLQRHSNEFVEHMTLAISLAGQVLVVIAIFNLVDGKDDYAWLLIALFQAPLALLMPNYLHRFFSSFATALSFSLALASSGMTYLFSAVLMFLCAWIWMNEFRYPGQIRKMQAIGYGLVLALIEIKASVLFSSGAMGLKSVKNYEQMWAQPWVGEILAGMVIFYILWQLLVLYGHTIFTRLSIITILATLLITALSIKAPGITTGMMIIVLGFAASNRVLQGIGVLSLLFFIAKYYYLLQNTLLEKSITLFTIGLALIFVRWLLSTLLSETPEVNHGQ